MTQQALHTNDPVEQQKIYGDILAIDPNNVVAANGYHEADQKIEAAKAQQQKQAEDQAKQSQDQAEKSATYDGAMKAGESAFLAGNVAEAQRQLAIAKKINPSSPDLQNLDARVSAATQARSRITMLAAGGGLIVLLGGILLLIKTAGKKEPYLEVGEGVDKGKRYNVDKDVIHIGAIAEDGDAKNEIVLRDTERMISRFHCEVHRRDSKLFLVDANSANGTFLDKRPIPPGKPVRLKKGSQIGLGGSCMLRVGFEKKKKKE